MDVSYYFSDLLKDSSLSDLSRPQSIAIAGRNLVKTVVVALFLCIEKLEKFVGLNLSSKLTT